MARPRGVAVLGGSFDHFHEGHAALLDAAFRAGARVGIGVTSDAYLSAQHKPHAGRIQRFAARRAAVERYLRLHYSPRRWWLTPLEDGWGRSVEPGVDILVASPETEAGAVRVNAERTRRHLPPVEIILIPLVRGDDGLPISARRIRSGAIDRRGRRLRPVAVALRGVGGAPPTALAPELRRVAGPVPLRVTVGTSRRTAGPTRPARVVAREGAARAARSAEYGLAYAVAGSRTGAWLALADASGLVGEVRVSSARAIRSAVDRLWRSRRDERKVITSRPASSR